MKRILALTDFSDHAAHALEYACNFANCFGTEELIILNTYEIIPLYDSGESASFSIAMQQTEELETQRKLELEKLLTTTRTKLNKEVKTSAMLSNSNLINAVNDICLSKRVDLVIMGIKVKDEIEQVLLGSHAHRAIEKFHTPVMVVPINADITQPEKIILVTNFYEAENSKLLGKLKKLLEMLNAKILIAHKLRKDEDRTQTETKAAWIQNQLKDFEPVVNIIDDEKDLGDNVNQLATDNNASLVISLHKKRGFFSRIFHNSTTKYLAWHSRVPVLVLHFE
ncbi:MAG: universal stress protein [Niabella sp.]